MAAWIGIMLALLAIAAGAAWQAFRLASRMRTRGRPSLRAKRAARWRRRRGEAAGSAPEESDHER